MFLDITIGKVKIDTDNILQKNIKQCCLIEYDYHVDDFRSVESKKKLFINNNITIDEKFFAYNSLCYKLLLVFCQNDEDSDLLIQINTNLLNLSKNIYKFFKINVNKQNLYYSMWLYFWIKLSYAKFGKSAFIKINRYE